MNKEKKRQAYFFFFFLIAAVLLLLAGINQNGFAQVRNKAIRICYECIGIG